MTPHRGHSAASTRTAAHRGQVPALDMDRLYRRRAPGQNPARWGKARRAPTTTRRVVRSANAPREVHVKLYYVPMTRSNRPRWMLEELGVPYQLARLDPKKGENQTPDYLAINPTGKVPALVDGEVKMFESAAIVAYLGDKFADRKLAPPVGS